MNGLLKIDIPLSDMAKGLHTKMMSGSPGRLYVQAELQSFTGLNSLAELMPIVQELLDNNLIKLVKQNNELKFQAVDVSEAQKKSGMSAEEALVYSYIEASGREGIWSKTIKARTNLHQHVVNKCLKSLEAQRYIKNVKSVKFPTRKIYMLYNLQPSVEITGGPWFTEGELDVEFINSLLTIVWRFVAENSFPNGFKTMTLSKQVHFSPYVKNYSTTQEILEFISSSQVAKVELSLNHIRSLCEVLVYDDKLEQPQYDCYRVTLQSLMQLNPVGPQKQQRQQGGENGAHGPVGILGPDDEEEFSIFDYYNGITPSQQDKEAVYYDEWAL